MYVDRIDLSIFTNGMEEMDLIGGEECLDVDAC